MTSDTIITALDLPTVAEAEALTERMGEAGTFYKIGYQLFPIGGYDLVRGLSEQGKKTFIDAKLLDIGVTVEKGVRSLVTLGADFLTVHADTDAINGAVQGRGDDHRLKILAVTVLTSWDEAVIKEHGLPGPAQELVLRRAEIAKKAGADGVIASPQEAKAIRAQFGRDFLIVTPGIRPAGAAKDDQKRAATPRAALDAGADHLVIGRPITAALDPVAALHALNAEIGG
ncbi:MAG: orotidine-5'-phosphate decarboxylase [Pseudomonadota bacterium]